MSILFYLIASRSPPGQDCRRQAMKEQMVEKMKYSRRALWKRTATNMPEESEHSYSESKGKHLWKDGGTNRCMAGGRKGRTKAWKEEGSDPRSERKGAEKSNIDPRIYLKRVPKSTKIVPKSTQKAPKTKIRQTKIWINLVKIILDPPWVAISRLSTRSYGALLGPKIEPNSLKKLRKRIQNHSKMEPKMVQNRTRKGGQEEIRKSVKTNTTRWFQNRRKIDQNLCENASKLECSFEGDFF